MLRTFGTHHPRVPDTCYIDPSAHLIGDVTLGHHTSVWVNAVLRGDVNSIHVGAQSNVQDCAVLHGQRHLYAVTVGDLCTVGHNATVHGCLLEDAVLIGIGATVLNNARIGTGSIVAAGAVVPEGTVIPPRSLVAGVPARIKRQTTDADLELILQYARNYLDLTTLYRAESHPTPTSS